MRKISKGGDAKYFLLESLADIATILSLIYFSKENFPVIVEVFFIIYTNEQ